MGTKEIILQNAFQLFLENGFTEVSINDIVAKAGVAKGGFYHYFKSKDVLIYEVIDTYICPFFEKPIEKLKLEFHTGAQMDAYSKLKAFYVLIPPITADSLWEDHHISVNLRDFHFLVFEGMKKYEYLSAVRCKFYKEKLSLLIEILEQGKADGSMRGDLDAEQWATIIIALKDGILSLYLLDETIPIEEKYLISFHQLWEEIKRK